MKLKYIWMLVVLISLALLSMGPVGAVPPDHANVPDHVREKIQDDEKGQDQDEEEDQEQNQDEDDQAMDDDADEFPNTSNMPHVGRAGNSHIGHMYLFEKNATDWSIVDDGAWGKMRYTVEGPAFDFVFNGHGLEPGMSYTLIYYPDPWPGEGLICLGQAAANEDGHVHIMGSPDIGSLPIEADENDGAKIWLVLTDDVQCSNQMTGWTPEEYLFEYAFLTYKDTDDDTGGDSDPDLGNGDDQPAPAGKTPAVIRSDLSMFVPEAQLFDQSLSFKLKYWKNSDDPEGIYFKLDKESLTIE